LARRSKSEALQRLVTPMRGKGVLRIQLPKPAEVAKKPQKIEIKKD
jgi:hypothetical protein